MAGQCAFGLPLGRGEERCSFCVPVCGRWAIDPYRDNAPDEDGDVCCWGCGAVFPGLDELRAAGRVRYPRRCRDCRADDRAAVS